MVFLAAALSRPGRTTAACIAARIPFALRVLVLYPLLSSAAFAAAIAAASMSSSRAAAYVVLPLALAAVLALTDASNQRAPSSKRVAWALLASIPTIGMCGIALNLATT